MKSPVTAYVTEITKSCTLYFCSSTKTGISTDYDMNRHNRRLSIILQLNTASFVIFIQASYEESITTGRRYHRRNIHFFIQSVAIEKTFLGCFVINFSTIS